MVKIFNLRDEVLKFAAVKKHDWADSEDNDYGKASTTKYGHVKIANNVTNNGANPVTSAGIYNAIANNIDDAINTHNVDATNTDKGHVVVDTSINNTSTNPVQNKAIYTELNKKVAKVSGKGLSKNDFTDEYKEKIDNLMTTNIIQHTSEDNDINNINNITEEGTFIFDKEPTGDYNKEKKILYGNRTNIYYTYGIIENKKVNNRIIQKVYSTKKIENNYYLDGSIYQRIINTDTTPLTYGQWHCVHINTVNDNFIYQAINLGTDVDPIKVFENTSGFIITWEQTTHNNFSYEIQEDLYKFVTICDFTPNLPIKGEYIFGNLVGKIDVKITAQNMQVRSTLGKGNHVYDVKASYFVPREC